MAKSIELTEKQIERLTEVFNPPKEEYVKAMAATLAVMTMSRIIHHQMRQTIKVFKNSMKEFSKEERDRIEDMALQALLEPIDKHIGKTVMGMDV